MQVRYLTGQSLALAVLLLIAVDSGATIHTVNMSNYTFSPQITTVRYGDTVRWVDVSGIHTTTSGAGSAKTWNSNMMTAGTHYDVVFGVNDGAGPFPYVCEYHSFNGSGMVGTIQIDQAMDVNGGDLVPTSFSVSQNYPNPFNPTTTIEYSVPSRSRVLISVLNVLGQQVRTLIDEEKAAGNYQSVWDGTDNGGRTVGSGVYLYRITAGDFSQSKKMLLMK